MGDLKLPLNQDTYELNHVWTSGNKGDVDSSRNVADSPTGTPQYPNLGNDRTKPANLNQCRWKAPTHAYLRQSRLCSL